VAPSVVNPDRSIGSRPGAGSAANSIIKDDINKKPLDPEFHIKLGPHVVQTVKRPKSAQAVEESIHKTYQGQEFVGEDVLESFGNEQTLIKRQTDHFSETPKNDKNDNANRKTLEDTLFGVLNADDLPHEAHLAYKVF